MKITAQNAPPSTRTPEQKQASKLYFGAFWPRFASASAFGYCGFLGLFVLLAIFDARRGFAFDSVLMMVPWFAVVPLVLALIVANKRAMRVVKDAGLLHLHWESIARTATTFEGESLEFELYTSKNKLGIICFFAACAVGSWCLRYVPDPHPSAFRDFLPVAASLICGVPAIFGLAFFKLPRARVDERGVWGFYLGFWPRLVRWETIACARILYSHISNSEPRVGSIALHNAAGKTMLTFTLFSLDAPMREILAAEIKRRLSAKVL